MRKRNCDPSDSEFDDAHADNTHTQTPEHREPPSPSESDVLETVPNATTCDRDFKRSSSTYDLNTRSLGGRTSEDLPLNKSAKCTQGWKITSSVYRSLSTM